MMTGVEGGERRLESDVNPSLASMVLLVCLVLLGIELASSGSIFRSVRAPPLPNGTTSTAVDPIVDVSAVTAAAAVDPAAVAAAVSNSNGLRSNKSESKSSLIESKSQKISFSTKRFSMFIILHVSMCWMVRDFLSVYNVCFVCVCMCEKQMISFLVCSFFLLCIYTASFFALSKMFRFLFLSQRSHEGEGSFDELLSEFVFL